MCNFKMFLLSSILAWVSTWFCPAGAQSEGATGSDASWSSLGSLGEMSSSSAPSQSAGQPKGGDSLIFDERGLKQVIPGESMSPWCPGTDPGSYGINNGPSQGGHGGTNSISQTGQGGMFKLDNMLQSLTQNGSAGNTDLGNMLKSGDISQMSNMVKDMLSGAAGNSGSTNDLGNMNINVPGAGDLDTLLNSAPEKLKKMQEYNETLDSLLKQ